MFGQSKIAFITLIIALSAFANYAQTVNKDEIEAEKLARLFYQRLQRTKSITPLIPEFFADKSVENLITKYNQGLIKEIFTPDVLLAASRIDFRRYYISWMNFVYLQSFYYFSKYSSMSHTDESDEKMFPPDVWRLIKDDSYVGPFTGLSDKAKFDDAPLKIESIKQLRSLINTFEKASSLMRKHVGNGIKTTPQYKETIDDFQTRFRLYKPWTSGCSKSDGNCYGLPINSKIIVVNIPFFRIYFARTVEHMRIVNLMMFIE